MINVSVDGDKIIKKKNINIGMAAALPSGNLIVPVIRNADQLNLIGLTRAVNDLAARARANKLLPDEVQDGTFTLTNIGSFGNVMGVPIINQPQVAIMAVGAIQKKPAVLETEYGDVIAIRHKMFISMSYDHRVDSLPRVKMADVVTMPYAEHGVKLYGNVIIASPKLVKENPAAIKAFLSAFTKGSKEVLANPAASIEHVKARDGIVNVPLETRRLQLAIDTVINSPDARAEGFGQVQPGRLALMASQVSDTFNTKTRVNPEAVWNGSFLPSAAELNILPRK